jgi:GNAT superfamily N-acetyltransferase
VTSVKLYVEPTATIAEHAEISIAFIYDSIFEVTQVEDEIAAFVLKEIPLPAACLKDYDSIDGEGPASWSTRFDLSHWGFIVARSEGKRVGGAVIAFRSEDVDMLEGRSDLAVLWDIRVDQSLRGHGIGAALFQSAEVWMIERGCKLLKVETQNINVAACKFYARQGCTLRTVNRDAYSDLPNEIQMLWYKDLG